MKSEWASKGDTLICVQNNKHPAGVWDFWSLGAVFKPHVRQKDYRNTPAPIQEKQTKKE